MTAPALVLAYKLAVSVYTWADTVNVGVADDAYIGVTDILGVDVKGTGKLTLANPLPPLVVDWK